MENNKVEPPSNNQTNEPTSTPKILKDFP